MSEETIYEARARAAHNAPAQAWFGNGGDVAWAPQPSEPKSLVQGIAAWGVGWFYPASLVLTPELYVWQGGWAFLYNNGKLLRRLEWNSAEAVADWITNVQGDEKKGRVIWVQEGRKP